MNAKRESINEAYEFVQPSYAMLVDRLDAVDGRIQSTQNFAATLTFAVPALSKAVFPNQTNFGSPLFIIALGLFGVILLLGVVAQSWGRAMRIIDPSKLYNDWLGYTSADEFKGRMIGYAAKDYSDNRKIVNRRANFALANTLLFGAEALLLLLWIAGA